MAEGWNSYINNMMECRECKDVAIVGVEDHTVWAADGKGTLRCLQPKQVEALLAKDTTSLFTNGVKLGDKNYAIIKNDLNNEEGFLALKAKSDCEEEKCNLTVVKSKKALIFMEAKATPGAAGIVCDKALKIACHLKECGY